MTAKQNHPVSLDTKVTYFWRKISEEKQASKYLIWKVHLKRQAALIVNNLSRPVTGWETGAAGEPSKCHPVASDYGGLEELPQSVPARGQPRRLAQATPTQASPGARGTGPRPLGRLLLLAGTADTQGAAGCTPPLPHPKSAGAQGTAAFREVLPHPGPTPRLAPAAGLCGRGCWESRPGTLGKAGAEEGAPLAAPSKQRSLFSMVPARPSYRTPFPVPFKGPTLCGAARARKV